MYVSYHFSCVYIQGVVKKQQVQICAEGCEGGHHLVHIGIIWQSVYKCPIWPSGWSAGGILTQYQWARARIHLVGWYHLPHNVYSQN